MIDYCTYFSAPNVQYGNILINDNIIIVYYVITIILYSDVKKNRGCSSQF